MFSRRNTAFFVHFACFSLLRFVLLDCQVCLVKRFVVFIIFAALQECCFRFRRQTVLFYFFCCIRRLMWAGGVSMSFCGGYGIGFYGFCFAADAETSFAQQDNRAHQTVCCLCLAAIFLFMFVLSLLACPNAEYAKLCESNRPLCGETDRRTLCRDDISSFGAVICERFVFLCGGER